MRYTVSSKSGENGVRPQPFPLEWYIYHGQLEGFVFVVSSEDHRAMGTGCPTISWWTSVGRAEGWTGSWGAAPLGLTVTPCPVPCSSAFSFGSCFDRSFSRLRPPSCLKCDDSHVDQCHQIWEVTLLKDPKGLKHFFPQGPTSSSRKYFLILN